MTKEQADIIEAVMLCDFSAILDEKFRAGQSTMGLSDIIQAKSALLKVMPDTDRVRRRAIAQLETWNIEAAKKTLERMK